MLLEGAALPAQPPSYSLFIFRVPHLEVAKVNLTLWSKIRRDSLDDITVNKEKEEDSLETKET